ncbi:MAG: hypothetical protein Q7R77_02200 [Candidatus Daviesbacteria bacterium]|nr:hypothetical protein [Candidatus Daviesbacteria bacterium]
MLNKRTNILFDEELWRKLTVIAEIEKTSVGQLIRTAVKEKYNTEVKLTERKILLEDIERIRPHFKDKIDYKELINYGRK